MDTETLDSLRIALDPIGQAGVAAALMLVMFGVALGLRIGDFQVLARNPLVYVGGVVAQIVLLPMMTFALLHLLGMHRPSAAL